MGHLHDAFDQMRWNLNARWYFFGIGNKKITEKDNVNIFVIISGIIGYNAVIIIT